MPFTDDEINQILQDFYAAFADRTYIGMRYVPRFGRKGESTCDWDDTKPYEPLTVVLDNGDSYTSKQYVPAGIDISNTDFWACTGNLNAQITNVANDVDALEARIDTAEADITAIETKLDNEDAAKLYGGEGTLVRNLEAVQAGTSLATYNQFMQTSKRTNSIDLSIGIRNTSGSSIAASTPLVLIKHGKTRYSTVVLPFRVVIDVYTADYPVTDATNRVLDKTLTARAVWYNDPDPDSDNAYLRMTYAFPDNSEALFVGSGSDAAFQNWFNSAFYDAELAEDLCDYFLEGDDLTPWTGTFSYSTSDAHRLKPEDRQTDCSGMTYIAYDHFGFHPVAAVQPAYLTDGIFIAYAAAGEKLDVSNARPGDIICYQNPANDTDLYSSWTHCCLYVGNDQVYETPRWTAAALTWLATWQRMW